MKYTLFEDYIPLQALLKKLSITNSGGAIKDLIDQQAIYYNGTVETRRRKKIYLGDLITIPSLDVSVTVVAPTKEEQVQYQVDENEKKRIQALVKKLNQDQKKKSKATDKKQPIRFPGQ